jgi:glycosyltransferase involved in cell wall biosynthesis
MPDSRKNPLVTVYVPCHNYGRFLTQAMESLFTQLYTNWEAIIIDEASIDDTPAIASVFTARDSERITLVRNEVPMGLQKVANYVLGIAQGKYIVRLDADDWFDEGALLLMVAKLESNPDLGLVYGNYFFTDEVGEVIGTERRHRLGSEDVVGHLAPHGACTLVRTRSLKAVGGYSEDINAQDGWELWYKLQNRVGAASLDIPVFYYRQHGKSLSRDSTRLLAARAKVFNKVAQALEGGFQPVTVAVIAVKEDYPGFKGVPYRNFEGCSLLEWAILAATKANNVTRVIVSSQSDRVLEFCEKLERAGKVPSHDRLRRPDLIDSTEESVPMREIMVQAGLYYQELYGSLPDIVTFLSVHAVRRRSEHIEKALNMLRITESDSVVSVQEERDPIFAHGKRGLELLNPGRFRDLAYDRERLYRFNGAVIAVWWEVLNEIDMLGEKIAYVEMSSKDSLQISNASMLDGDATGFEVKKVTIGEKAYNLS